MKVSYRDYAGDHASGYRVKPWFRYLKPSKKFPARVEISAGNDVFTIVMDRAEVEVAFELLNSQGQSPVGLGIFNSRKPRK